jgi:type I restriction enzyme R subunit
MRQQVANSPTLSKEIMHAVTDAHRFPQIREGLRDVLLRPGQLYEALKDRAGRTV